MIRKYFIYIIIFLSVFAAFTACNPKEEEILSQLEQLVSSRDLNEIKESGMLRVGTMEGASSYFLFGKEELGYNYELISDFASHLNVELDIQAADSENELREMLLNNEVDLIAYNMYETKELKEDFHFVFPQIESHQILVQRLGRNSLLDVTDLAGKDVYVKKNSIFHKRLEDLNDEIGGTINIMFAADSLTQENLIEMVLDYRIDYTMAYYDDASLYRNYHENLDYHVPMGFTQHNGWLIKKTTPELLAEFEKWKSLPATDKLQQRLESKYKVKNPYIAGRDVKIPEGSISPYDALFKKYAKEIGWDWRLLAAIAFHESTFDSTTVSRAGASGLMQLMPKTAKMYGVTGKAIFNPEENIRASVQYIKEMNRIFKKVKNKDERIKFILAGYNGGPYHVVDAMSLAEKYGRNPYIWFNNVEYFLEKKKVPEFYKDKVVKYGSFNARETVRYVENTLSTYEKYMKET